VQLTFGDVCKVTGIAANTLDRWSASWLGGAAAGGQGTGHHRRYGLAETFAVYAGLRWRAEGADSGRVANLVRFLARVPSEHLEAEFEAGRTLPVLPHLFGELELPAGVTMFVEPLVGPDATPGARKLMKRVDLGRLWKEVKEKIDALKKQPLGKRGRKRTGKRRAAK